jgi:hypothetical protein
VPVIGSFYAIPVVIGCAALAWAGLEKLRDRGPLAATVAGLGLPAGLAAVATTGVPLAELATVATVVAGAPSPITAALFAAFGVGFALAALWSVVSGRRVSCACFGVSGRNLGWPQLAALPLWLLAAWSVHQMPHYSTRERLGGLACGALVLAAVRAFSVLRLSVGARSDRHARAGG